jgi:hypothetical protein
LVVVVVVVLLLCVEPAASEAMAAPDELAAAPESGVMLESVEVVVSDEVDVTVSLALWQAPRPSAKLADIRAASAKRWFMDNPPSEAIQTSVQRCGSR